MPTVPRTPRLLTLIVAPGTPKLALIPRAPMLSLTPGKSWNDCRSLSRTVFASPPPAIVFIRRSQIKAFRKTPIREPVAGAVASHRSSSAMERVGSFCVLRSARCVLCHSTEGAIALRGSARGRCAPRCIPGLWRSSASSLVAPLNRAPVHGALADPSLRQFNIRTILCGSTGSSRGQDDGARIEHRLR